MARRDRWADRLGHGYRWSRVDNFACDLSTADVANS